MLWPKNVYSPSCPERLQAARKSWFSKALVLSSVSKTGSSEKPPGIMLLEMDDQNQPGPFFISSRQVSG